MLPTLVCSA